MDVIQSIVTTLAIIVGAGVGYWKFVIKREKTPHANISHTITDRPYNNDMVLLSVVVTISNVGSILLTLPSGIIKVCQMVPPSPDFNPTNPFILVVDERKLENGHLIDVWPGVEKPLISQSALRIEPGESDQLYGNFLVHKSITTLKVHSEFNNPTWANLVWRCTTVYDLHPLLVSK